jgi:hypothetical protein
MKEMWTIRIAPSRQTQLADRRIALLSSDLLKWPEFFRQSMKSE